MTTLRALIAAGLVVGMFGWAVAKLPPPPPMDEKAKAAAEEKKTKDAAGAEAAKAAQARAEDRVVARYGGAHAVRRQAPRRGVAMRAIFGEQVPCQ